MKAPKFIAAMAIAAILSSGAAPSYAAKFTPDAGNGSNGQTPMQSVNHFDGTNNGSVPQMDAEGDIEVSGEFTKVINNFPTPDQEGRYLRVTMPIKMDFKYDVDKDQMTSAVATITNNSVYAENANGLGQPLVETPQSIDMTFVSMLENGTGNSNTIKTEFVDKTTNNADDKVKLPFKLSVTSAGNTVNDYNLTRIKDNGNTQSIPAIKIPGNGTVQLELKNIDGQVVGNKDLIKDKTSLTSHNLKLKFEYKGK